MLKVPKILSAEESQIIKAKEQIAINNQISTYQIDGILEEPLLEGKESETSLPAKLSAKESN